MQPAPYGGGLPALTPAGISAPVPAGYTYIMPEVQPLTPPPGDLQLIRMSSPWKIYGRMLGTVVVAFIVCQLVFMIPFGIVVNDPFMSICGAILAAPFVFLLTFLRRPRLVHLQRAAPSQLGSEVHRLPMGGSLQTPVPTTFAHHIIRDDSILDTPPSKTMWIFFAGLILTTSALTALMFADDTLAVLVILIFIVIGIPAWLLGFSIPVVAWWSWCTRRLSLHTRQREAESWIVGGMLSTIPALTINSLIYPLMAGIFLSEAMVNLTLPVVSAPIGEELCKGLFVLAFASTIDTPKRGFQVGFTVGLGFAMLENLMYVLGSLFGGPLGFTFTALVRGLGSIPGHAFWTGLTGTGLGWYLMDKRARERPLIHTPELVGEATQKLPEWKLVNPKTGEFLGNSSTDAEEVPSSPVATLLENDLAQQLGNWRPAEANWTVPMPKHPLVGLGLAMAGHAMWNGSLTLMEVVAIALNWSDSTTMFAMLGLSVVLVGGIIILGRAIISGVLAAPTKAA